MFNTLTTHVVTAVPTGNVWDKITNGANSAETAVLAVGGLAAIVFVLIAGWRAKGAVGGIVSAGLTAMLFGWFLVNVNSSSNQQTITDTINDTGMPSISQEYRPANGS